MLPISRYAETQVDTVLDRRDKDMMREAYSFMAEIQYKYTVRTRDTLLALTCSLLWPTFLVSAPYMVHITRYDT